MKAEVVSESVAEGGAPSVATAQPGQLAGDTATAAPPAADDDFVKETPTAANRIALPAEADDGAASPGQRGGLGTYRILRPSTTDFVESPVVTKTEPAAGKRVVIGAARLRR